jgi:FSR family fosmidomycin resistance protein-like MFS transporter
LSRAADAQLANLDFGIFHSLYLQTSNSLLWNVSAFCSMLMNETTAFQRNKIFLLSGGHAVTDAFTGFLPPLLPLLMSEMKFSIAGAGVLATILSTSTSLLQPIYGAINDAMGKRFFVYLGPLVTAGFICLLGYSSSYAGLVILLALCGTGSAAFHPAAAALVGRLGGDRKSLAMSIFVTAGNFGHSISPLIVVPVAMALGLRGLPVLFFAGALLSFLLFRYIPAAPGRAGRPQPVNWRNLPLPRLRTLGLLQIIAVVRAFVIAGLATFLPVYMYQNGVSLFFAGATGTLFHGIGSLGGLVGGHLGDRINRNRFMQVPMFIAVPLLLGFFYMDGAVRYFCLMFGGIALYLSLPLNVVLAVELFPRHAGTVSALMIGFAWGVGGLLLTPFGVAADRFGLEAAMIGLILLLLAGVGAALLLVDEKEKTSVVPDSAQTLAHDHGIYEAIEGKTQKLAGS